jgi:phospholipase/carboxylesterase
MWFPVDMMALQVALLQRNWQALAEYSPPGLDAATAELGALMEALAKEGTPDSEVVVAGFSQGALVAANWAFHSQRQVAGLILFSAMMQRQSQWDALIPGKRGLPVLQVHSPQDPVVPYVLGERLLDSMTRAGLQVTFLDAPPGHYIHVSMIEPLGRWLLASERLDAKSVG